MKLLVIDLIISSWMNYSWYFLFLLINFPSSILLTATLLLNIFLMQTFFYSNFSVDCCYLTRWNLIEKLFLNICFRHMFAQFRHIEKFVNLSKSYYCIDFFSFHTFMKAEARWISKARSMSRFTREKNHLISVEKGKKTFLSRIFNKRQTEKSIFEEISKSNHFKWIQTKPGFVHEKEPRYSEDEAEVCDRKLF